MVSPRTCSSTLVSVNQASPESLAKMMVILQMSKFVNVDFL